MGGSQVRMGGSQIRMSGSQIRMGRDGAADSAAKGLSLLPKTCVGSNRARRGR